jgi:hypothetical protein
MPVVTPTPPIVRPRSPLGLSTFDHIGAVFGENLCGERTDDDRSQIEDTYAVQGTTRHSKSMFTSMEGSTIRSEDKGFQ